MANGESRTARPTRERLEAIKNFLPVRDSVREKLQARQKAKVEFATGAEELFKPVTTATEKAATVTKEALTGETGILPTLAQHGRILEDISAGLHPPPPPPGEGAVAGPSVLAKKIKPARAIISPAEKFKPEFVKALKNVPEDQLASAVITGWKNRYEILNPKYYSMRDDKNLVHESMIEILPFFSSES